MSKTKKILLKSNEDFEKIVLKNHITENKIIITFKRKKTRKFLENWYKKLNEFVEEQKQH